MTPELEKAARAIEAEGWAHYGRGLSVETVTPALARAAILALREPNEELVAHIANSIRQHFSAADKAYGEDKECARAAWLAGIDHITGAGK